MLEEEKARIEVSCKNEIDNCRDETRQEVETLTIQCAKYKQDLMDLTQFTEIKQELELELKNSKLTLEKKDIEFKDTIHNLERKVLQDKVFSI